MLYDNHPNIFTILSGQPHCSMSTTDHIMIRPQSYLSDKDHCRDIVNGCCKAGTPPHPHTPTPPHPHADSLQKILRMQDLLDGQTLLERLNNSAQKEAAQKEAAQTRANPHTRETMTTYSSRHRGLEPYKTCRCCGKQVRYFYGPRETVCGNCWCSKCNDLKQGTSLACGKCGSYM